MAKCLAKPITRDEAQVLATMMKAVADPSRLQLVALLRSQVGGEACVCDLTEALGLSQATVSHHMGVLTKAGIVTSERRGYWTWYSVVPSRLADIASVLT